MLTANSLDKQIVKSDFNKFFSHRLIRLLPEYISALFLIAIIDYICILINPNDYNYFNNYNIKTFIYNLLLINPFPLTRADSFGSARQLWTLPEIFYCGCLFSHLYFILKKNNPCRLKDLVILIFFSIIPIYSLQFDRSGMGLTFVYMLGIFCYYFFDKIHTKHALFYIYSLFILSICYLFIYKNPYRIEFYIMSSFFLIYLLSYSKNFTSFFLKTIIKRINKYSYSLYLIHYSIFNFVLCCNKSSNKFNFYLSIILSIFFSVIITDYIANSIRNIFISLFKINQY